MADLPVIGRLDAELNNQLLQEYEGERSGFIEIGKEKWFLPMKYEKFVDELYNFEVRPEDTWIVTFPRSGTTVISELIWLLQNNLEFDKAKRITTGNRFRFIEMNVFIHDELLEEVRQENSAEGRKYLERFNEPGWEILKKDSSPRFIKTHLPFQLLPKNLLTCGTKVIYVARNPKDVAVSCHKLYRMVRLHGYTGDFENFWNEFEKGLAPYTPYWDHVIEGWNNRNEPNMLFLFYEDYCMNSSDVILKVAKFLEKNITKDQVNQLIEHLNIDKFKKNEAVNLENFNKVKLLKGPKDFIRKGKVGSWVDEFTPKLSAGADKWIEENLKGTDLRFPV